MDLKDFDFYDSEVLAPRKEGLRLLALVLDSRWELVAGAEIRDGVRILIAAVADVEVPHTEARETITHVIDCLALFALDNPVDSIVRDREDKGIGVALVGCWQNFPVFVLFKAPRDSGVPTEYLAVLSFDDSDCWVSAVAHLVKSLHIVAEFASAVDLWSTELLP